MVVKQCAASGRDAVLINDCFSSSFSARDIHAEAVVALQLQSRVSPTEIWRAQ